MKPSEKELKQRLLEKLDSKKIIPVSINGTIVNAYEGMLKSVCEKPKSDNITPVDITPNNITSDIVITPGNIVEDVLAYKKAQLQKHKENCQCKGNVCICTDEDECTGMPWKENECADECHDECADECHEEMIDDARSNKANDFNVFHKKMSYKELGELKDILKKSREITKSFNELKNLDEPRAFFGTVNKPMIPDEKLIKEWKDYKSRVDDFIAKHPKLPKSIVKAFMLDEYPQDENKQDEQCLGGVKWDVAEFEKITKKMFDTYKKKNADYGNSFDDLFDEFGMTSALIRMKDKYNRLKSITEKKDIQVKDESVEDTPLDLANYCILTILKLRKNRSFSLIKK